jgi:hypothetical protein
MKSLKLIPTIFFMAIALFSFNNADAQISISPCPTYNVVASGCVGSCGNPTGIIYTSSFCVTRKEKFCLSNDGSNLCPNMDAKAVIYVNGVQVASGNITAVGSSISFSAPCGANIKIKVGAVSNGNPIQCIQLGDLYYSLRKA